MAPVGHLIKERKSSLRDLLTPVQAAALSIPVALPAVFGYETNPAFLLAPLVAWAALSKRDAVSVLFMIAGIGGLASVFIAALLYPDGRLFRDILSLVLMMFAAGFYFLGREVEDERKLIGWIAIFSAIFVIPVADRLLIIDAPVRFQGTDDYTYFNAVWFGLPTFASFGVNAGVHLVCIQTAIFCGVIFGARQQWLVAISTVALSSAVFLIIGSESRSSILALVPIFACVLAYAIRHRSLWRRSLLIAMAIVIGIPLGVMHSPKGDRSAKLVEDSGAIVEWLVIPGSVASSQENSSDQPMMTRLNSVSTGRLPIIALATQEFLSSPIIGTGFSRFGRYDPIPDGMRTSSTSHVYYLTILWKGGLLFGVPFLAFLSVAGMRMLQANPWRTSPEAAMAMVAVLTIFGFVALTYDTPNVPAVGSLAFLLLGALGNQEATNG